jgi:hypothetical protein
MQAGYARSIHSRGKHHRSGSDCGIFAPQPTASCSEGEDGAPATSRDHHHHHHHHRLYTGETSVSRGSLEAAYVDRFAGPQSPSRLVNKLPLASFLLWAGLSVMRTGPATILPDKVPQLHYLSERLSRGKGGGSSEDRESHEEQRKRKGYMYSS